MTTPRRDPISPRAAWRRAAVWGLVLLVIVLAGPQLAEAAHVVRYRCTLLDGSVSVVAQNLAVTFPNAVQGCVAVQAAPEVANTAMVALPLTAPLASVWTRASPRGWESIAPAPPSNWGGMASGKGVVVPPAIATLVREASERHRLDPQLVAALMYVESRYQPHARSPKGAMGLMQIMPATGARYGVASAAELLQPATNIDVGARYLRDLHRMFNGHTPLVLAAYNAGEGAVIKYGRQIPPYRETQDYVRKIMGLLRDRSVQAL